MKIHKLIFITIILIIFALIAGIIIQKKYIDQQQIILEAGESYRAYPYYFGVIPVKSVKYDIPKARKYAEENDFWIIVRKGGDAKDDLYYKGKELYTPKHGETFLDFLRGNALILSETQISFGIS